MPLSIIIVLMLMHAYAASGELVGRSLGPHVGEAVYRVAKMIEPENADLDKDVQLSLQERGLLPPPKYPRGLLAPPKYPRGLLAPPRYPRGLLAPPRYPRGLLAPPRYPRGLLAPPKYPRGLLAPPKYPRDLLAPPKYPRGLFDPPHVYTTAERRALFEHPKSSSGSSETAAESFKRRDSNAGSQSDQFPIYDEKKMARYLGGPQNVLSDYDRYLRNGRGLEFIRYHSSSENAATENEKRSHAENGDMAQNAAESHEAESRQVDKRDGPSDDDIIELLKRLNGELENEEEMKRDIGTATVEKSLEY